MREMLRVLCRNRGESVWILAAEPAKECLPLSGSKIKTPYTGVLGPAGRGRPWKLIATRTSQLNRPRDSRPEQ